MTTALTPELIKAGSALIGWLEKFDVIVSAAFWLVPDPVSEWQLYFATPQISSLGPKYIYRKLAAATKKLPPEVEPPKPYNIVMMDVSNPVVQALGSLFSTGPGISNISISRSTFNGMYFEGGHIYRMNI